MALRMYCVFSKEAITAMTHKGDVELGKMSSQAGHAYTEALMKAMWSDPSSISEYLETNRTKITCVVDTTEELTLLYDKLSDKVPCALITDSGLTVFDRPTVTCLGIGPVKREDLEEIVGTLRLLRRKP